MRRLLLFLSVVFLYSAVAFAYPSANQPDWFNKQRRKQTLSETGVAPMLVLSLAAIGGGLALKRRRSANSEA